MPSNSYCLVPTNAFRLSPRPQPLTCGRVDRLWLMLWHKHIYFWPALCTQYISHWKFWTTSTRSSQLQVTTLRKWHPSAIVNGIVVISTACLLQSWTGMNSGHGMWESKWSSNVINCVIAQCIKGIILRRAWAGRFHFPNHSAEVLAIVQIVRALYSVLRLLEVELTEIFFFGWEDLEWQDRTSHT